MDTTVSQQLTELRQRADALCVRAGGLSLHSEAFRETQSAWFTLQWEIKRLRRLREEELSRDAAEKQAVTDYMRVYRRWTVGDLPILLRNARRTKMWLRRLERSPEVNVRAEFVRAEFTDDRGLPTLRHRTRWILED